MLTDNWQSLTPDQKYAERMQAWMDGPGLTFPTQQAQKSYAERAGLIRDAVELRKPARVPICPFVGLYPIRYAGVTMREAMYDYAKLGYAMKKFYADFALDGFLGSGVATPGKVLELLDYKLYQWAGHGVAEDQDFQTVEDEYMLASEYDLLLQDPSDYWMRRYMPRVFGALKPLEMLPNFTNILEIPSVGPAMVPFGTPEVQESLKTLLAAGEAAMEWRKAVTAIDTEIITTQGIPTYRGGFTKAPFDIIGDTMRGTRPMMFDLFRHRDKVIETVERLVPMATQLGVRTATLSRNPMVFIPLHKGVDSFMSNKDFETFYWPTLKSVVLGLIEEGCVPMLFVEGAYNSRLDILSRAEIPAGRTIWVFEHTEMAEAKAKVGPWGCIGGNVPGSLLQVGTPEEVDAYVKDLLGKVAGDGGFILGTGLSLSDASAENFRAMVEAGGKYGS